jgi:mono/diheme cytochrome c family protein/glucose/arabinose dehydrogenase
MTKFNFARTITAGVFLAAIFGLHSAPAADDDGKPDEEPAPVQTKPGGKSNPGENFNSNKNANTASIEIKFKLPPPPPLTPAEELKTFQIDEGLKVELVASEPQIEAPVAMSFDDQGRLYVAEMRGFMTDLHGTKEKEPSGRISLLTDRDGDGRYETVTPFVEGLVMPRSVMAVNGGVLILDGGNLVFCKDTNGDGVADVKEIVVKGVGGQGATEYGPNSPTWTLDNNVWLCGSKMRFRWKNGTWQKLDGLDKGQWGLAQDDFGRLFYNSNSDLLRCALLPPDALTGKPQSLDFKVPKDQKVYPSHPTPGINRGYGGGLSADGKLQSVTAACGPGIYRGDLLPAAYRGNAFACEPTGNLVKRLILTEKGGQITGENAIPNRDFLTSTDERFRPVNIANGPDGALYIVDMSRGIVQHKGFLTTYLAANVEQRKLETPTNQGRIWRIVPANGPKPVAVKIPAQTAGRVAALGHANGWVRDTAQRLLVESSAMDAIPLLAKMLAPNATTPLGRIHALATLDGLGAVNAAMLKDAFKDPDPKVRAMAARVATPDSLPDLAMLVGDKEELVQAHVAIKLAAFATPESDAALAKLVSADAKSFLVRDATQGGLRGRDVTKVLGTQGGGSTAMLESMATTAVESGRSEPYLAALAQAAQLPNGSPGQVAVLKGLARDGKIFWVAAENPALAALKRAGLAQPANGYLEKIDKRVAWAGKPGAPPPPAPLTPAQQASFQKGKAIYSTTCIACHQATGLGQAGLAPPLVDSAFVLGQPDVPARIVLHGLSGPIRVGNAEYNLAMPPVPLSDQDIAAVLTYIRREWDHTASPVEPAMVTELRTKYQGHGAWTAGELKK